MIIILLIYDGMSNLLDNISVKWFHILVDIQLVYMDCHFCYNSTTRCTQVLVSVRFCWEASLWVQRSLSLRSAKQRSTYDASEQCTAMELAVLCFKNVTFCFSFPTFHFICYLHNLFPILLWLLMDIFNSSLFHFKIIAKIWS